jgi:TIR domain
MAIGLYHWIGKVIQFADPFLSSDDIQAGERWDDVLGKNLTSSDFGILCITSQSKDSPWMLFEAGALSGTYQSPKRVVPYLLDMEPGDLRPPLGRFNAVFADEDGTYKLLDSLNKTPYGQLVPDINLRATFTVFWHELNDSLQYARKLIKP